VHDDSLASPAPAPAAPALSRALVALLTIVFVAVLVRTAWIGDDAMISLRTVLNVTHGFGLTFNIAERVQTFTHPLWLLLVTLVYWPSGNVFYAVFGLSFAVSIAVFWLAVRRAPTAAQAAMVSVVLLFSRAFVDYSTSGLENPLAHLLVAALVVTAIRHEHDRTRGLTWLWLLSSLLYLTRPDMVLFAVPFVVMGTIRARPARAAVRAVAAGLAPAAAWTLFSLIYYGFPFPNTAYAKLGTGISHAALREQGLIYLIDSLDKDPLTLVVIAFGILMGAASGRPVARRLAAAIVIYLLYVVAIGGDFMGGRFLSVPLVAAVLLLGWLVRQTQPFWLASAAVCALVGTASAHVPLYSDSHFDDAAIRATGITDERGIFFTQSSLARATRQTFRAAGWPTNTGAPRATEVMTVCGLLGGAGLSQGPYVHLLDDCALADPLLARMPALFNDDWRIGHFRRMVPAGYEQSLTDAANELTDPQLSAYYDAIRQITRDPHLFAPDRLRTIVRMNTGHFDRLINTRYYRHGGNLEGLGAFAHIVAEGTPADAPGIHAMTGSLAIMCDDRPGRRYIDISVDSGDEYKVSFLKGADVVASMDVGKVPEYRRRPGMASHPLELPPEATRRGFDTIVVEPVSGDEHYALGHLLIEGNPATDADLYAHRRLFNEPVTMP
jgi:arabinofuranosyltransferase